MLSILSIFIVGILSIVNCQIALNVGVHLFVDDQYLANISSLQFQNGVIQKDVDHPIVYPEYPWENAVHFATSFLQVPADLSINGKPMYLIYYVCIAQNGDINKQNVTFCVANSTDGITWEKPLFWYYPYVANGIESPQPTNIVFATEPGKILGSVFIDIHPGIPRSEKFKMAYGNESGMYVYVSISSDGFKWTPGTQRAHPLVALADTQAVMLNTGDNNGPYIVYGRRDQTNFPNTTLYCPGTTPAARKVIVSISNDSVYGPWSEPVETFQLGPPDPIQCLDSYNSATLFYKGVYFLFPSTYLHWAKVESGASYASGNDGVMDIRLAVSRTPLGPFNYPSRDSFISRGIGTIDPLVKILNGTGSDRDAGFVFSSANGLLDPDFVRTSSSDENPSSWMYHLYWGSQITHGGAITLIGHYWPGAYLGIFKARLRREGYVALSTLNSDPTGHGSFVTQVVSLPKSTNKNQQELQLQINAEIATAGLLNVQIEDGQTGNPISGFTFDECRTLHGNGIRQLVQWTRQNQTYSADLTPLVNYNNGIRIRMNMVHTKLYSWIFSYV